MNLINIKKINNYKSNIARILSSIMAKSSDECDLPYRQDETIYRPPLI